MATYVLVHGAYQGGWIWKPVATRLRAAGHLVYTPTLDGCAERHHTIRPGITVTTHAQEIAQHLFYEDLKDVVLVGTSSGGMVIVKAGEQGERVDEDQPREQVDNIVNRTTPRETTAIATGPTKADAEKRLFSDLDPDTRAWALARYTLHPITALDGPMDATSFWNQKWLATVIRCRRSVNPPETHQRRTAERLGGTWHELDTGHYPMLSQPDELTGLLLR